MTRLLRSIHTWLGLLIGLQFLLWVGSGLVMSLLDAHKVHGQSSRAAAPAPRAWIAGAAPLGQVLEAGGPVDRVASGWVDNMPVYRLMRGKDSWLVDARDGRRFAVDAALAGRLAKASYKGDAPMTRARLLAYSPEVRPQVGNVWRIDVLDRDATTIYVAQRSGEVLAHRNSTWRLFDFVWMLHIMDYRERTDFNHPLVVGSAGVGALFALGGLWLLGATFRLREFVPRRGGAGSR